MPPNLPRLASRARKDLMGTRKMLLMWLYDKGVDPAYANDIRSRMEMQMCSRCYCWRNELDVESGVCSRCAKR